MTVIKTRDIRKGLTRKGFREAGGDHVFLHYYDSRGRKSAVFTKLSHSMREVGGPLLGAIARQLRLDKADALDLIQCPMSAAAYEAHLRDQGEVD